MSAGSLYNQTCYPTQKEAFTAACSAVHSTNPDGTATNCITVIDGGSTTAGGGYSGQLRFMMTDVDGNSKSQTRSVTVWSCERYDYDYWSPLISAWVAALVALIAARILYVRLFQRETL
jgi:hypothetical protein